MATKTRRKWQPDPAEAAATLAAKNLEHPALQLLQKSAGALWWRLRFDGSCNGNGSASATGRWGFQLIDEHGQELVVRSGETHAVIVTNNVSEWMGLAEGLTAASYIDRPKPLGLAIEGDSKLVISCLPGRWASRNPELTTLRNECRNRLAELGLPWSSTWIPREENEFCDSLT